MGCDLSDEATIVEFKPKTPTRVVMAMVPIPDPRVQRAALKLRDIMREPEYGRRSWDGIAQEMIDAYFGK